MKPKKIKLKQEIFLLLLVKLILLYFLWLFCFSHPLDKGLTAEKIVSYLYAI